MKTLLKVTKSVTKFVYYDGNSLAATNFSVQVKYHTGGDIDLADLNNKTSVHHEPIPGYDVGSIIGTVTLSKDDLALLPWVLKAAEPEKSGRAYLSTVCFDETDIVSTTGKVMHIVHADTEFPHLGDKWPLLYAQDVRVALDAAKETKQPLTIDFYNLGVIMRTGAYEIRGKYHDGNYVPWRKVIPDLSFCTEYDARAAKPTIKEVIDLYRHKDPRNKQRPATIHPCGTVIARTEGGEVKRASNIGINGNLVLPTFNMAQLLEMPSGTLYSGKFSVSSNGIYGVVCKTPNRKQTCIITGLTSGFPMLP